MEPLLNGVLTGLFLQIAVGPVFFYILGIAIDSNFINTLFAILAVTLVDYIYIILSIIGIGKFLQQDKVKLTFGLISSLILILFGMLIFYKGLVFIDNTEHINTFVRTPLNSFTSCFALTISSPLTIVFWSSIFSAKAIEKNYIKKQLVMFGLGAGAATLIFLFISMLIFSLIKSNIPNIIVQVMNCIVGLILIYYGITRSAKFMTPITQNSDITLKINDLRLYLKWSKYSMFSKCYGVWCGKSEKWLVTC